MPFSTISPWLLALLVAWALLLFGGFIFGKVDAENTRRMPAWTRMASSLTLVIAGWSWYFLARGSDAGSFALLVAIGMTFGFLGDLFMAKLIPISEPVLGGIGSFGLGHIAYIVAFVLFGNTHGLDAAGPRWAALGVWLLAGAVGWYFIVFRGQKATALHWAALPYALLLSSTAGLATGLALQASLFALLALGGGLFLLSDLILAAELFNNARFPLINDVVWLTYGPAQMFIVYSIASALAFPG